MIPCDSPLQRGPVNPSLITAAMLATLAMASAIAAAQQKNWISDGSGSWFEPGRWSPAGVPSSGHDVLIERAGADPTVSVASGTADFLTLDNREIIELGEGGAMLGGLFNQRGQLVVPAGVTTNVLADFVNWSGASVRVGLNADLGIFDGNFTQQGYIELAGGALELYPDDNELLNSGMIECTGPSGSYSNLWGSDLRIINGGGGAVKVTGNGSITLQRLVTNQAGGLLEAASGGLEIYCESALDNAGEIRAAGGSIRYYSSFPTFQLQNSGSLRATNAGYLYLGDAIVTNGGSISVETGGVVSSHGEIVDAGGSCSVDGAGSLLDLSYAIGVEFSSLSLTNDGVVRLWNTQLSVTQPVTNEGIVTGSGTVSADLDNAGTILVEDWQGILSLQGSSLTNTGILEVRQGALEINHPVFTQRGNVLVFDGGVLHIPNGAVNRGYIVLGQDYDGGAISGGPLVNSNGAVIEGEGDGNLLNGSLSNEAGGIVRAMGSFFGGELVLAGPAVANAGLFDIDGGRLVIDNLTSQTGTIRLCNGGELELTGDAVHDGVISVCTSGYASILGGGSLTGSGTVEVSPGGRLNLEGLTAAFGGIELNSGSLWLSGSTLTTSSPLEVGSGSSLYLYGFGSGPTTLDGTVVTLTNGIVSVDGGAVVTSIQNSGVLNLLWGVLTTGLTNGPEGSIISRGSAAVLDGAFLDNSGSIVVRVHELDPVEATLSVRAPATNFVGGTMSVGEDAALLFDDSIRNEGSIVLDGGFLGGVSILTNASNGTIEGNGRVGGDLDNQGLVRTLIGTTLLLDGLMIRNIGTLRAANGSVLWVDSADLEQSGSVEVRANAVFGSSEPLVNRGVLNLVGGTFVGEQGATNAAEGFSTGFGVWDGRLDNEGLVDFYGNTDVIGTVGNSAGGLLRFRNQSFLVTGQVVNDGIIEILNADVVFDGGVVNHGLLQLDGRYLTTAAMDIGANGYIAGGGDVRDASGVIVITEDFLNGSTRSDAWRTETTQLHFNGGPHDATNPQMLEAASEDRGSCAGASVDNFAWGRIRIGTSATYVRLVDLTRNGDGILPEVVYTGDLVLESGTTLDLNGLALYYSTFTNNGGTVLMNGGRLVPRRGVPMDFDGDGDVDVVDLPRLAMCLDGPETQGSSECVCADGDGDGDIDLADYALFQQG